MYSSHVNGTRIFGRSKTIKNEHQANRPQTSTNKTFKGVLHINFRHERSTVSTVNCG